MIKAKEVSLKNITILLVFSLAVSAAYFVSRTQLKPARSVPIFVGEEVIVKKVVKAIKVEKAVRSVPAGRQAEKAVEAVKAPMPPKVAQPLPIVPPSVIFKVLPSYPSTVLEKGREGMVLLSVYVGLSGQPGKIEIKSSSGAAELDDAATKAISQWRFSPAARGGAALASWFEVPVRFELK